MGAYSNDTSLNILASYAYLGNNKRFEELAFDLHRKGVIIQNVLGFKVLQTE